MESINAIVDWAQVQMELLKFKLFSFSGQWFMQIISPENIQIITVFMLVVAWILVFYYFIIPLMTSVTRTWWDEDSRAYILSIIPRRTKIIIAFLISSVIYFMFFVSLITWLLKTISQSKYYAITNTILIIDQDEDEKKQELLKQIWINEADTQWVYKDKLSSPDTTYDVFAKQNYPEIKIQKRGYIKVCWAIECSDNYSYTISQNLWDKWWIIKFEFEKDPLVIEYDNWDITSDDLRKIVYLLQDKWLLKIFWWDVKTRYTIIFQDEWKKKKVLVFSPWTIHYKYMMTVSRKLTSTILGFNKTYYEEMGVEDTNINEVLYPWFLESKMFYPNDPTKQVRTYNVSWLKPIYTNIIPYEEGTYLGLFHDLKAQNIDTSKLETNLFGASPANLDYKINTTYKIISKNWSDQNGMLISLLAYIYNLVPMTYPIAIIILIGVLIVSYLLILIKKFNIEDMPKTSRNWEKVKEWIGNISTSLNNIWLWSTIDKVQWLTGTFPKLIIAVIVSYLSTVAYIWFITHLFTWTYTFYSEIWAHLIIVWTLMFVVWYKLAEKILTVINYLMNKAVDISMKLASLDKS